MIDTSAVAVAALGEKVVDCCGDDAEAVLATSWGSTLELLAGLASRRTIQ